MFEFIAHNSIMCLVGFGVLIGGFAFWRGSVNDARKQRAWDALPEDEKKTRNNLIRWNEAAKPIRWMQDWTEYEGTRSAHTYQTLEIQKGTGKLYHAEFPLEYALRIRERIQQLVTSGHGQIASGLMSDVDQIVETVYTIGESIKKAGCGSRDWAQDANKKLRGPDDDYYLLFTWAPGIRPLVDDSFAAIQDLLDIEKKIREVYKSGLASTKESAMLRLQVRQEGTDESAKALLDARIELVRHPLPEMNQQL